MSRDSYFLFFGSVLFVCLFFRFKLHRQVQALYVANAIFLCIIYSFFSCYSVIASHREATNTMISLSNKQNWLYSYTKFLVSLLLPFIMRFKAARGYIKPSKAMYGLFSLCKWVQELCLLHDDSV